MLANIYREPSTISMLLIEDVGRCSIDAVGCLTHATHQAKVKFATRNRFIFYMRFRAGYRACYLLEVFAWPSSDFMIN